MIRTSRLAAVLLCLTLTGTLAAQTTFNDALKEVATQRGTNNLDKAEAAALKAIELADNNDQQAQGYQQLTLVYNSKREYAKALESIEKGLAIEGLRPTRKYSLVSTAGATQLANGDFNKAREYYTSITDAPDAPGNLRARAIILLASTYSTSNREYRSPARARELLKSVQELTYATANEKTEARLSLANLEVAEKNYDQGIELLINLIAEEGVTPVNRVRYRISLGHAYRAAKNYDQAVATYDLVLSDDVASPVYKVNAQQGKAAAHNNAKAFDKAKESYEALLTMPGASAAQKTAARNAIERINKAMAQ